MGNARSKLNVAFFNGCLFISAVFGWIAESWGVFLAALAVTLGCGLYTGELRLTGRSRSGQG